MAKEKFDWFNELNIKLPYQDYLSFSGGVESTTMCILYGGKMKAIWCNTGSEHKLMYDRIDFVESEVRKIHPNFEIVRIIPQSKLHGKILNSVEEYAIEAMYMPSPMARYCTREFKIEPIDNFLKQHISASLAIGLNYDEQGREGNFEKLDHVMYWYPLQEEGYTRSDCEDILIEHRLHPSFPPFMFRGGCRMCPFKTEKEYKAMYWLSRDEFVEVMLFEEAIQDRRKKFYSIMGNGKSLRQLMRECEIGLFDLADMYVNRDKNETSCGLFCHR